MKMRVDKALVELGIAPSKTKAQELIEAGEVEYAGADNLWRPIKKSSFMFETGSSRLRLRGESDTLKYVSRGGLKLEGALLDLKLDVKGYLALDVGASTGGFTDCLLQLGVKRVIAIDVSKGELAKKISGDPRVAFFGEINARDLHSAKVLESFRNKFDLAVIDVSFISLTKVVPEVFKFLRDGGVLLALVKPQFEVGPENLDKKGIVKSIAATEKALLQIQAAARAIGFLICEVIKSRVKGKDGNQEYFLYAKRPSRA